MQHFTETSHFTVLFEYFFIALVIKNMKKTSRRNKNRLYRVLF